MSIRYWFPSDEELAPGVSGVAITDEDGGFVAGAMRCFAGVALAGMLAANTLAAQLPYAAGWQGDERVVPATLLVDETDYLLPTPVIAPLAVRAITDDDQYVSASTFFVERYEWPVVVGPPIVPRIVQAVTDDTEYVGYLGTDEDGWQPPRPSITPLVAPIRDETEYAPALSVDEYGTWPQPVVVASAVTALTDDDQYVGYLGTDEDGQWRFVVSASPLVQAITDDSDFVVVAPSALEHGDWSPVVPLVPSRVVQAAADDDQYVGYLGTDEDGWLAPVPARTPLVVAITDDDVYVSTLSFFAERYEWPVVVVPPFATPLPVVAFADDDQYVGYLGADDDGLWPRVVYATPQVAAVANDSDYTAQILTVLVDEDAGTWPRVFSPLWVVPSPWTAVFAFDDSGIVGPLVQSADGFWIIQTRRRRR